MATGLEPAAIEQFLEVHGKLSKTSGDLTEGDYLLNLALQILHNLKHQHRWTELKLYTRSPVEPYRQLQRPLLSGLPPRRLYTHPDEQIEHLKRQAELKKTRNAQSRTDSVGVPTGDPTEENGLLPPVREWVLPTHLREQWSLRKMAASFDAISFVPPQPEAGDESIDGDALRAEASLPTDKWRQTKRLLLATMDDDSTVVYYVVHDGIVKPRQN